MTALRMASDADISTMHSETTVFTARSKKYGKKQESLSRAVSIMSIMQKESDENTDPNVGHATIDHIDHTIPKEVTPSPLDFVKFFPWLCLKMGLLGFFVVIKVMEDVYVPLGKNARGKKEVLKQSSDTSANETPSHHGAAKSHQLRFHRSLFKDKDADIPIHAHYNALDQLTELHFMNCDIITQKHIKVLNLCLPFHMGLTKLSITKCNIHQEVLYEIGQLLTASNITEIILDDTRCIQGNYYVLLEYASSLKRLSLNRCNLSDSVIKEIFKKLEAEPAKTLQILELSSNFITNVGALAIGNTLRTNRELLHLNLAGNRISNKGASYILTPLMKFQLTNDEIMNIKQRRMSFSVKKLRVFQRIYQEQFELRRRQFLSQSVPQSGKATSFKTSARSRATPTSSASKREIDINQVATRMTNQVMGSQFRDVFDLEHTIIEDDKVFCTGNFKLASVNFAYNHLGCVGLRTVIAVLEYQAANSMYATKAEKGLVRIILDGNDFKQKCDELEAIHDLLEKKTRVHGESTWNNKNKSARLFPQSNLKQRRASEK